MRELPFQLLAAMNLPSFGGDSNSSAEYEFRSS